MVRLGSMLRNICSFSLLLSRSLCKADAEIPFMGNAMYNISHVEEIVLGSTDEFPKLKIGASLQIDCCSAFSSRGRELLRAWRLMLGYVNQVRGGLKLGGIVHKVELTVLGDYSIQAQTQANMQQLISRGFRFFLGPFGSVQSEYAARAANATAGALMMSTAASNTKVFRDRPHVFGTFSPSHIYFDHAVATIADAAGSSARIAALFIEDFPVSRGWAEGAKAALAQHDFQIIAEAQLPFEMIGSVEEVLVNWNSEFYDADAHPLILAATYSVNTCIEIARVASKCRLRRSLIVFTNCIDQTEFKRAPLEVRAYTAGVAPWVPDVEDAYDPFFGATAKQFAATYRTASNIAASYIGAAAYGGFSALLYTIWKEQSTDATAVSAALQQLNGLPTVYGKFKYNADQQNTLPLLLIQFVGDAKTPSVVADANGNTLIYPIPVCGKYYKTNYVSHTCKMYQLHFLIILILAFAVLMCAVFLILSCVAKWRKEVEQQIADLDCQIDDALWDQDEEELTIIMKTLSTYSSRSRATATVRERRKLQSEQAGVSVTYLLSSEFSELACRRTGERDPTFNAMKPTFWFRVTDGDALGKTEDELPLGWHKICPRDQRQGCALLDTLAAEHRRKSTHFLSWTWQYQINQVQSALHMWMNMEGRNPDGTFLYMCFFVNNQFRIIVQGNDIGDLETVFEYKLLTIGKMVAILDGWDAPMYLTRIWTIFEQFTAAKLEIPVRMILPKAAFKSMSEEMDRGKEGILAIKESLSRIDSENAEAWRTEDREKVQKAIWESVGYDKVNACVKAALINWVGDVVMQKMRRLIFYGNTFNEAPADGMLQEYRINSVSSEASSETHEDLVTQKMQRLTLCDNIEGPADEVAAEHLSGHSISTVVSSGAMSEADKRAWFRWPFFVNIPKWTDPQDFEEVISSSEDSEAHDDHIIC